MNLTGEANGAAHFGAIGVPVSCDAVGQGWRLVVVESRKKLGVKDEYDTLANFVSENKTLRLFLLSYK
jgi:hypothetical protein